MAVTFTTKAAAELQERARQFLIQKGRVEDAQRLRASRMGTVNSVCGRLLTEFAFDLGLSPEQNVLDDVAAKAALGKARSLYAESSIEQQLAELGARLPHFKPEEFIRTVIDRARANGLEADQLWPCQEKSVTSFLELLEPPFENARRYEREVADAMKRFLDLTKDGDGTKTTDEARSAVRSKLIRLQNGRMDWDAWVQLATLKVAKRSEDAAADLLQAAGKFHRHPQLREDLKQAIRLVFQGAVEALTAYQRYKQERGAVDFPDQLARAHHALQQEAIREQLAGEIDLVLVDEFQDTNPLQLAIFLELAGLSQRSVWVGDQKQSIFGFIDTDPVLMDSAIEAILGEEEPETLDKSWRSRPELVRLTSDLFAEAFAQVDIPESRTRLEPAREKETAGLGQVVEHWRLSAKNVAADADALAAGVRELLADPEVRVRDRESGEARPPRRRDVAILCRTNLTALRVAEALARLGISSVLPRRGLLNTHEAQLVLAGLQRWVDPRDTLAAAKLARLGAYPAEGDAWLEVALRDPYAKGFGQLLVVQAIDRLRREQPASCLLEVFDQVVEAVGARERVASWGRFEERSANLDALRALVVAYERLKAAEKSPATVAGLIPWLLDCAAAEEDQRAVQMGADAVVVSTWHGAKGLEWPITVLFELGKFREDSALGVTVVQAGEGFRFEAPLADRWIRFWPNPFHSGRTKSFLHDRVAEHRANREIRDQQDRERLRLFYVGWTRARDRVVLAHRDNKQLAEVTELVRGEEGPLLSGAEDGQVTWAGRQVALRERILAPAEPELTEPEPGELYVEAGPREYPPALLSPSGLQSQGKLGAIETIGEGIDVRGASDMTLVGEALHSFFAADVPELSGEQRRELAESIVRRWQVDQLLSADDLRRSSDELRAWVEKHWPEASWHREWPLHHRLDSGTLVRGNADLVLATATSLVLVDHKPYRDPGKWPQERLDALAGQLGAYAAALQIATSQTVGASWVHLPLAGCVVELELLAR